MPSLLHPNFLDTHEILQGSNAFFKSLVSNFERFNLRAQNLVPLLIGLYKGLKGFEVSFKLPVVIVEGVQQPHILVCAGHTERTGREDERDDVVDAGTNSPGP